jgi:hypothetical protein
MFRSVLRIVSGYAVACLAAGATLTAFVVEPGVYTQAPETAAAGGLLIAMAATQTAIFALPFAAIGVPLSEWFRWRGWLTYVLLGTGISMTAYGVAIVGEAGRATLWNDYAFKAFLAAGVTGGLSYWLVAGRNAGGPGSRRLQGGSAHKAL